MDQGGHLLELFGSDLVTHRQSPAWNRGSILLNGALCPSRLLTERAEQDC